MIMPMVEHEGQRVITTELLAQVYETDTDNIKHNYNNHKENFKEGIHYYRLKGDALRAFKREVNDIPLVAPHVNQLYLWTERGASRHCKILDTPKAWEQFDNLEETYFLVREQRKPIQPKPGKTESQLAAEAKRATAMILNAKNRTAERFQKLWDRANVKPEYQAMALGSLFAEDGVNLPRIALQGTKVTYDKGQIAEKLPTPRPSVRSSRNWRLTQTNRSLFPTVETATMERTFSMWRKSPTRRVQMNKDIVDYKTSEYAGKMGVAFCRGDLESAQKYTKTLLVLYRLRAREAMADYVQDTDELRALKRTLKKAGQAGIVFPLGEKRVETLEKKVKLQRERLVGYGESIVVTLDWWQSIGATLADLCNLCNRDYPNDS